LARKLIYIRIIHSQADYGTIADGLAASVRDGLSAEEWRKRQEQVAAFWRKLRANLMRTMEKELQSPEATKGLPAPAGRPAGWSGGRCWEKVRIYQDGLPAGGETALRIVEEVAEKGSANYQLVRELLERGARIEKTEEASLLQEEYRLIQRIVSAPEGPARDRARRIYGRRSEALLAERDRFIAKRVDETLADEEVGLLFIGSAHRVSSYLPADIEIISLS